ncbi:hypothetical protein Vadar_003996 [Vaccinium darrowii]|uniref:Uncharacterized protein n=1 Tax=Vaccinium darrowii TaxID=229202 RepID=A0ACB7Y4M3_9ERIC|nr:hypothetical protein Vadar_003996 [Vaccinium darrowii]
MEFCTRIANHLMLKSIQDGVSKNVVSSPLSINAVLNMLATGSTGHTLERILGFLGSKTVEEINSKSRKMVEVATGGGGGSTKKTGNGPILTMVNGAWVDKRFPLVAKYKEEVLKGIFKCEANNVDFRAEADEAVDEINSWANTASKGLIKKFIEREFLFEKTALILANGLYFKGIWDSDYKFNARRRTQKYRDFYLLNGGTVLVPFMTSSKDYYHGSFDGFKVLKIPYKSHQPNKFSMYFFLPDKRDGLQNLLEKFNSNSGFLNEEYFKLAKVPLVEFWIPKFKFSFDFDVLKVMRDMGESLSFIENPRDLSEMMHIPSDVPSFFLKMFQKAYIELDEKETEAAAVTVMAFYITECDESSYSFVADHPFLFMIREEGSGLVFFTGAVMNPIQEG